MTGIKRRRFLNTVAAATAAPALVAQDQPRRRGANPDRDPAPAGAPAATATPPLRVHTTDEVAAPAKRFFAAAQMAALTRLADILAPAAPPRPGALEAGAPEFLDFLISQSDTKRQQTYRNGLDALNKASQRRFAKPFADVDTEQAAELLAPLREPWKPEPPTDPIAALLIAAKADVRTATVNSREYAASGPAPSSRRGGFGRLYWYPLD
ncbi:MAG: gluconate 2-dehydrogenase subunit 3 family protein [Bryobacteraceae bacterium]